MESLPNRSSSEASVDEEVERRVHLPTFAKGLDKGETPVRPVSARTYQQLLAPQSSRENLRRGSHAARDVAVVYLHDNALYGEERTAPRTAPGKTFAEKRRSARLREKQDAPFALVASANTSLPAGAAAPQATALLEQKLKARGLTSVYDPRSAPDATGEEQDPCEELLTRLVLRPDLTLKEKARFVNTPGARQHSFSCYILRDRSQSKTYPKYFFHAEDSGTFLLSARRRKKSASSNYLISLMEGDLARDSPHYFGKVRSNFIGTQFLIYNNGERSDDGSASTEGRAELGAVLYEHNVLGTRGPRRMKAVLPKGRKCQNQAISRYLSEKEDNPELLTLVNKTPKWNDQLNEYCLNFKGRVTKASVKNFQLVHLDDDEQIVLQFGKVDKDRFNVDYGWPISALQAFAICLSSFDSKLACE